MKFLSNVKTGIELLPLRWIFNIDLTIRTLRKKEHRLLLSYSAVILESAVLLTVKGRDGPQVPKAR